MVRKVVTVLTAVMIAVISVVLVGGQTDDGFLWWGNHEAIYIFGDGAFTYDNGVTSGSGSADDPYIIEGWHIDSADAEYGIYIDHTTRHFIIRQCVIERAKAAAICLNTVKNGRIEGCQLMSNEIGVHLLNSDANTLVNNVVAENSYGVVMTIGSRGNRVFGNSFIDNGLSGLDSEHRNMWYDGARGNYWSDYSGVDLDHDGVGDSSYAPLRDRYPLISPPVPWTRLAPAGPAFSGLHTSPDGMFVITSPTEIVLESRDRGSGLARILYSIDGGAWQEYTTPLTLTGPDGPYQVSYYGIDNLGNVEAVTTLSFLLDNHPPETMISFGDPNYTNEAGQWITSKTPITLELLSSSTYGETKTYFSIDNGHWRRYNGAFTVAGADGPHLISYYSQNASGNAERVQTITVFKDDAPPTTRGARPLPGGAGSPLSTSSTVQANATEDKSQPEQTPSEQTIGPAEVSTLPESEAVEPADGVTPPAAEEPQVQTPSQGTDS
jgi:parallel beta-helix repeat protein